MEALSYVHTPEATESTAVQGNIYRRRIFQCKRDFYFAIVLYCCCCCLLVLSTSSSFIRLCVHGNFFCVHVCVCVCVYFISALWISHLMQVSCFRYENLISTFAGKTVLICVHSTSIPFASRLREREKCALVSR